MMTSIKNWISINKITKLVANLDKYKNKRVEVSKYTLIRELILSKYSEMYTDLIMVTLMVLIIIKTLNNNNRKVICQKYNCSTMEAMVN